MTRPLLVLVAQGLDLLTFLMVVAAVGVAGEANGVMVAAWLAGPAVFLALKASGSIGLACIAQLRPRYLVYAAGAGILGASVNLIALRLS